ncbi:MAG: hypothetical protein DRJ40_08675 [Thermoprotei archaeon]|nr:MAG: hypothetical protein DRJ40_08675 [Thermoprotei archaeon]
MLSELLELADSGSTSYDARVVIHDYTPSACNGYLQVTVPHEVWWKWVQREEETIGIEEVEYVLGFDVNTDRVNWALVDETGDVVDLGTIWFEHLVTVGRDRRGVRGFVIQGLHKLFTELRTNRGMEFAVAVEGPKVLKTLKLVRIRRGAGALTRGTTTGCQGSVQGLSTTSPK